MIPVVAAAAAVLVLEDRARVERRVTVTKRIIEQHQWWITKHRRGQPHP